MTSAHSIDRKTAEETNVTFIRRIILGEISINRGFIRSQQCARCKLSLSLLHPRPFYEHITAGLIVFPFYFPPSSPFAARRRFIISFSCVTPGGAAALITVPYICIRGLLRSPALL